MGGFQGEVEGNSGRGDGGKRVAEGRRWIIGATWRVYNAYDTFKREIGEFESSAFSTFPFCFFGQDEFGGGYRPCTSNPFPAPVVIHFSSRR